MTIPRVGLVVTALLCPAISASPQAITSRYPLGASAARHHAATRAPLPIASPTGAPFAVVDARVFDGTRVLPRATVLVKEGRIASVTSGRPAHLPATVIDGRGRTLLPGLIDAHFHAEMREASLASALRAGVTTVLDMFSRPADDERLRAVSRRPDYADYRTAGPVATAPGGHGTQYGFPTPTISTPDSADAFVASRVGEGSQYLKVIIEPGTARRHVPTLDSATVQALATASHRRGMITVAHVSRASDAAMALGAGVDGLAHLWHDTGAVAAVAVLAAARGAFVVPTLVVRLQTATAGAETRTLAADPRIGALVDDSTRLAMRSAPWARGRPDSAFLAYRGGVDTAAYRRRLYASVASLHAAGVRLLAGTDVHNVGMVPVVLHRELALLVDAGLTPVEALSAATAATADAFRLADRGRIAPGQRADLLLVTGDPTRNITATRGIVDVWKEGVPLSPAPVVPCAAAPPIAGLWSAAPELRCEYDRIGEQVRTMNLESLASSIPPAFTITLPDGRELGRDAFVERLRAFRERLVRVEKSTYQFESVKSDGDSAVVTFVERNVFVLRDDRGALVRRCTGGRERATWRRAGARWEAVRSVQTALPALPALRCSGAPLS